MEWVEGRTLDSYVGHLVQDGDLHTLATLATTWRELVRRMQGARFAHGDLQHGNVLVDERGILRLVDLDCAWISAFDGGTPPGERGHRNFQHPDVRWGPHMDTFPALVVYLSLVVLARNPAPWKVLYDEDNLLFRQEDFRPPFRSPVWEQLAALRDPEVDRLAAVLKALCGSAAERDRDLEALLTGTQQVRVSRHEWVNKLHNAPTPGPPRPREPLDGPSQPLRRPPPKVTPTAPPRRPPGQPTQPRPGTRPQRAPATPTGAHRQWWTEPVQTPAPPAETGRTAGRGKAVAIGMGAGLLSGLVALALTLGTRGTNGTTTAGVVFVVVFVIITLLTVLLLTTTTPPRR
jgi:eukaryotic-like serine/threonine-protein kinase